MSKPQLRERLFWWIMDSTNSYHPGDIIPSWLKIIRRVLWPIKEMYYSIQDKEGFQPLSNTWLIHGMCYSDAIFRHLAYGDNSWYRVVDRKDGLAIIEKRNEAETK